MRRLLAIAALAGCGDPAPPGCDVVVETYALTAAERKVVGEASPYPADPLLRGREAALIGSQRARREAAWAAVARALAPVELAEDLPAHDGPESLPRWHTWYGRDDLLRIFQKVWRALPVELREVRAPIPDDALDAGFAWNPRAVEELDSWPEERWRDYVDSLDDDLDVQGVGGIARVGYAPGAARHLLASYAEEIACLDGVPPAFVDGPPAPPTVTREAVALGACEARRYGPFFVAGGEQLTARVDGGAAVEIDGDLACAGAPGEACTVDGPGAAWVIVSSTGAPVETELVVEHVAPDAPWSACLAGRFPLDAAVIKADWRRAELGFELPVHATTAAALAAHAAGDEAWGDGEATADPGPDEIYTVRASSGNVYRLAALHLMTRELDHWMWVTLWWSDAPDTDLGADRPAAIAALGAPWDRYKMCTTAWFTEGDPDPTGGFSEHPDLGAALAAVHGGAGAPSWCSNPYLEVGTGNASSNCIGCHQHGGTGLPSEIILGDDAGFPARGRTLLRNNFPADYAWSTDRGDRLAEMLKAEVDFWDGAD